MDYTKYVNIDIGTDSEYRESNGNTLPNVQYPFANQSYIFQSNKSLGGWFYKPNANYIEAIRVSNQPSPWLGDYGHISLLPYTGNYNCDLHTSISDKYHSPISLKARLNRYKTDLELIACKNGARLEIVNNTSKSSKLMIDCHQGLSSYSYDEHHLYLTIRNIPESEYAENYRKFYVLKFSCKINEINSYLIDEPSVTDTHYDMVIDLTLSSKKYQIDLISSYISHDLALLHLNEQEQISTSGLKQETKSEWNKYLSTIELAKEVTEQVKELFYSNLYRCFCYPRIISEIDSSGKEVYYNFKTKEINEGIMISDVGFWDTYRTTMPLYRLLIPSMYQQFISAIINYYKSYGWLPRWLAPFERGIMPSTLIDSVVSCAIVNEMIEPELIETAIEALLKNADKICDNKLFGRDNLADYLNYGYVPQESRGETVSLSLDNYYCDYAIYKALSKCEHPDAKRFYERANQFHQLFNPDTKFFERKNKLQKFDNEFDPTDWGYDFCESSAWQNNLSVSHDVEKMFELFGSKNELEKRLDLIFSEQISYKVGSYGFEIHEMTEYAKIHDLGHFAISNQPSFNLPFWYLILGQEQKFASIIERTMKYFTINVDGYPGDEDNGSLAAWYILVQIGKYPFCPVEGFIEFESKVKYKINKI